MPSLSGARCWRRDVAPNFYPAAIGVWRSVLPSWAGVAAVRAERSRRWSAARLEIIDDGHLFMLTQARETAERIEKFLSGAA